MNALAKFIAIASTLTLAAFAAPSAYSQTEITSLDTCLERVHALEDRSLSVQLNAEQFNLLIEILVAATDLCRQRVLDEVPPYLAQATDIIEENS
ncbi:hypothetical protein [Maritalea mediterranea]|uniref:UrcA family protein n=1 Tax=Maritalea mediterranea TaxID=2909667 RepID=A0ABS9E8D8_9HYPH|nr:hypothetical protein [Maritalea mediterranea]MCF4098010.1 hypothetical protein [Maritalea mediterranea]